MLGASSLLLALVAQMQAVVRGRNTRAGVLTILESGTKIKSAFLALRDRNAFLLKRGAATLIQNQFRVRSLSWVENSFLNPTSSWCCCSYLC